MCSTTDKCWASPRNNQRLNQTSPHETLAQNKHLPRSKRLTHPTESVFLARFCISTAILVINVVFFALFLCTVILVVPVCFFVRKVILYYSIRRHRDGKLSKMSASEAVWLQASGVNTEPVANLFFLFEGNVTIDEVQNFVRNKLLQQGMLLGNLRLLKFRLSPVRVLTGYGWKELDNLNIDNYVLENKGNSSSIHENWKGITEMSNFKDLDKLWRVVLFPKFNDSEDTGVLFQMHESIADVFPFMRVVLDSLDYKTVYLKRHCFLLGRLATYLCACFTGPLVILKRMLTKRKQDLLTDHTEGSTSINESFHVSWSGPIDFKSVKRIKDVTRTKGKDGTSLCLFPHQNDVIANLFSLLDNKVHIYILKEQISVDIILLSCVAGAIRSFLQKCNVQYPDDILVCIRTDVRPQHTRLQLDNKFSLAFIKLPVGTEGAVPRLWETRRRIDKFSFTLESIIIYGFIKLCLLLFPLSTVRRLINYLINKVSCTVTQIPGPNMPVYLNGKMSKMMTCWAPRKTESGLSISITNHGGQIHVGLVTHHSQINDPSLLLVEFEREVADLGNHLGKRALPSHLRWRLKMDQRVNDGEREVLGEENI